MEFEDKRPVQPEIPLTFPELYAELPLLPARMINEYQYCPRLAYLEWIQGEWAESVDTVQGRYQHRRVNRVSGKLPDPKNVENFKKVQVKSTTLSSESLGVIAKFDLIEVIDGVVKPVEYKKGKRPHIAKQGYEPERVQLCVQGLLLSEHGYDCKEGALYYVQSKERVRVVFDYELINMTMAAINGLRTIAAGQLIPPPLQDSPKCPRCSLVGICLPDEINFLQNVGNRPRPLSVARKDTFPVYIQDHRASVRKKGDVLEISLDKKPNRKARLREISQVVLMGNVYISTPALHELMRREIPVTWHSYGGWFLGHSIGTGHKNVELRTAQYQFSFDEHKCLKLSQQIVRAKILNSRVLMRRNWKSEESKDKIISGLRRDARKAMQTSSQAILLGVEGYAAARYFGSFSKLIKEFDKESEFDFDFTTRNRRPPTDPINALLSYAYALLTRTVTVTLTAVGFDVYRGFFHQPRYGRPALALDMMEPFRPLIADSVVLTAVNNGEVQHKDFVAAGHSVNLTNDGRKRFIATFERRLSQEVTHPIFGYRISYRRLIELHSRLLARFFRGEIFEFPQFLTR